MKYNPLVPELLVSDIEESLQFYVDLLEFKVMYSRENEGFYFIEREGSQIMLDLMKKDSSFTNTLPTKPFGRGINFEMAATDIEAFYNRVVKTGYSLFRPLKEDWYQTGDVMSGTKQFLITDPDGYLLRFCEYAGEKPVEKEIK